MDIVIVSKSGSCQCLRVRVGLRAGLGLLLGAVAVIGTLLYGGYYVGAERARQTPGQLAVQVEAEIQKQQQQIDEARRTAQDHMNALAAQLGKMRSHVLRLDALGSRLVDMASLDAGEFNFGQEPALGGPVAVDVQSVAASVPDFIESLQTLARELDDRKQKLGVLEALLMNRDLHARVTPEGRPVNKGWLSSRFGLRTDPLSGKKEMHEGMDFAGKEGTEILAVGDGVVTWSARRSGYGNLVEVNHGNGYRTRYGHNKKNLVKVGDRVKKGQVLALMGSTGRSTGPHVHLEVFRNGKVVNPAKYVASKR